MIGLNSLVMGTIPPPLSIVKTLANAGVFSYMGVHNIFKLHFRLHLVKLLDISNRPPPPERHCSV